MCSIHELALWNDTPSVQLFDMEVFLQKLDENVDL